MNPTASIEGAECYLPAPVLEALAADPTPLTKPRTTHFDAAMLMADIAGFTPLSEKLAERGPVGAEQLSRILNTYFTRLIGLISAHGGHVVKFAGDALLAIWPAREESLETATLRASQCGLLIHEQFKNFDAGEQTILSVHLSISAGLISTLTVGGVLGRWEFVVVGDPMLQARKSIKLAGASETVLAPEAWALVHASCIGKPLEAGCVHLLSIEKPVSPVPAKIPHLSPEAEAAVWSYLPGAVRGSTYVPGNIRKRLESGQTDWFAELRQISVIFINIPEIDEQSPEILAEVQAAMVSMQQAIYRYEASVDKLSMDFAGLTLLVVLGLPPLSHPDDPIRAVKAALAMRAQLKEFGFTCSVGITSGRAFCGAIGSKERREYTIIGDVVNSAARLMVASKGDVYCDRATFLAVETQFELETLPPIRLKGKAHEVPVFRPVREKRYTRKLRSMVGRIEERRQLEDRLARLAHEGRGGAVLIESEAGMGKSQLIAHLLLCATESKIWSHVGFGNAIDRNTSGHAWIDILRTLLGIREEDHKNAQSEAVLTGFSFSPKHQAHAALLNDVLQLDIPESELIANMPAEARSEALRDLVVELVRERSSHGRLLLVMEDIHWLDSTSRKWLFAVHESVSSVLLVLSTRPQEGTLPAEWENLERSEELLHLRLGTLSNEDIVNLVCQQLGVFQLPGEVAKLLVHRAEGHPLFAEELGQILRETGVLEIRNNTCTLAPKATDFASIAFPKTLAGVIRARLDRLSTVEGLAIKVASICGRVFSAQEVEQIFPLLSAKHEVAECLERLATFGLTPRLETEPEGTYIFKHALIQEVAYELMMFGQRAALHRSFAEWLESKHSEDMASQYPRLAHHWSLAGDKARAVDFYEKAASQAAAQFANEEAIHFYQCAITLEAGLEQRVEAVRRAFWHRALAESQYYAGLQNEGLATIHAALELLGCPTPHKRWLPLRIVKEACTQALRRIFPTAIAASQLERERLLELARLNKELTRLAFHNNDVALLLYGSAAGLNYAEQAGPSPELAPLYIAMALNSAAVPGFRRVSEYYLHRTKVTTAFVKSPTTRAWVEQIEAVFHMGRGEWETAHTKTTHSVAVHERYGHRRMVEEGILIQAYNHFFTGDFSKSADLFSQMETRAEARGDRQSLSWAKQGIVRALLRLGEVERPRTIVESSRSLIRDQLSIIDSHGTSAYAWARAGNWTQAFAEAEAGLAVVSQSPQPTFTVAPALSFLAETYIDAYEQGTISLSRVLPKLRKHSWTMRQYAWIFPFARAQAAFAQGFLLLFSGKPNDAFLRWSNGLRLAREGRMPFEQGRLHLALALHGPQTERESHQSAAEQLLTSCKAEWLLRRATRSS